MLKPAFALLATVIVAVAVPSVNALGQWDLAPDQWTVENLCGSGGNLTPRVCFTTDVDVSRPDDKFKFDGSLSKDGKSEYGLL